MRMENVYLLKVFLRKGYKNIAEQFATIKMVEVIQGLRMESIITKGVPQMAGFTMNNQ